MKKLFRNWKVNCDWSYQWEDIDFIPVLVIRLKEPAFINMNWKWNHRILQFGFQWLSFAVRVLIEYDKD